MAGGAGVINPSAGGSQALAIPRIRYGGVICYTLPGMGSGYPISAQTIAADTLHYFPFIITRAKTFDRLAVHVDTAGAAGTVARLGIYNADTDWQPTTLVLDAGTVAVDSLGVKAIDIDQVLDPGVYLLALVSDGTPRFNAVGFILLGGSFQDFTSPVPWWWRVLQAYGALPDPGTIWITADTTTRFLTFVLLRESIP